MDKSNFIESFRSKVTYRYMWKLLYLLTFVVSARFLDLENFAFAYLPLLMAYFFMDFFDLNLNETDGKSVKKFCNTLSILSPMVGVFVGIIIMLLSFLFPTISIPLRLSASIVIFHSVKFTPETFYLSRGYEKRVHKIYAISQFVSTLFIIISLFFNLGYVSIIYGHMIFFIMTTTLLWTTFPFSLKPKIDKKTLSKIYEDWKVRFKEILYKNIIARGILIFIGVVYGLKEFSVIFLSYMIGHFMYREGSSYIVKLFRNKFNNMNFELFKINFRQKNDH